MGHRVLCGALPPSNPPPPPQIPPPHGAQVVFVLPEAVDAPDGDGFDSVAQEQRVVAVRAARGLVQQHQQQRLQP